MEMMVIWQVKGYTVIVTEDDSKDSSLLDMLRWKEVQSYNDWPPYQVLFTIPLNKSSNLKWM